ncbi:class I SAM-dependent methyltransferase [Thioalkalivibrio sp.]|uniref:class I SAM-dependent methyltransferase n=1 Tax=Thioalkalivibrio sp. TaxID=2093813 RepID=UPI003976BF81
MTWTPDLAAFGNRLRKNARHWTRWARREDTECFRVYDRDLPEFPLQIDCYGPRVHVQLLHKGRWTDPEVLDRSGPELLETVAAVLTDGDTTRLAAKIRERGRGGAQYADSGQTEGEAFLVREHGLLFEVNLERYLDTGLFLDHRSTRARVRAQARGSRFLNLFAYTGSFTVHAAAGGARSSLTLDLSNTYTDWARRNLALNGLDRQEHQIFATDVLRWLEGHPGRDEVFDLIVLDPPSFSNSKRMETSFDVQRDHPWLINRTLLRLAPDGLLLFSTNRQGFELHAPEITTGRILEISRRTTPPDFQRHPPHRCWEIRH